MRSTTTSGLHAARLALLCAALSPAACASARQTRSLGAVDVRGWRVEVVGWTQHRHQRGALLVPASDQWAVGATLRATRAGERAPIDAGSLWSAPYGAEAPARAQFDALRVESCGDEGRAAFRLTRLPGPPHAGAPRPEDAGREARWIIVYAFASTLSPTARQLPAATCGEALAATPPPARWLREGLEAPVPPLVGHVPLRTLVPGAAPFPRMRRQWAEEMLGPLLVAAHEGLEPELALDFTLRGDGADRRGLLAENELYRVAPQRDAYGDVDVLRAERARLLAAVARGLSATPDLEAHLLRRLSPEPVDPALATDRSADARAALEAWALELLAAAPSAQRRGLWAREALRRCSDPSTRPLCHAWRMAALGRELRASGDAALCVEGSRVAEALGATAAGSALAASLRGCGAAPR